MSYSLGLDIGSTAAKILLVNDSCQTVYLDTEKITSAPMAVVISLIFWFLLAYISSKLKLEKFYINILIAFFNIFLSVDFLEKGLKPIIVKNSRRQLSFLKFL